MIKSLFYILLILISFNINCKEWQKDIKDILVKSESLEYTVDLGVFHFFIEDIAKHATHKPLQFKSAEEASEVTFILKRLILISEELLTMSGNESDKIELKYISTLLGTFATNMNFKGSYKKTKERFQKLLKKYPKDANYNSKYANFLFNTGEELEAIKYYEKATNYGDKSAYYNLAYVHISLNNIKKAESNLNIFNEYYPEKGNELKKLISLKNDIK